MRGYVRHVLRLVGLAGALLVAAGSALAQSMDPEVLEHVKHATVMVKMSHSKTTKGDTPLGSGTGFFVNATGLCITNDHVIDPAHGKSQREKMQAFLEYNRLTWRVVVDSGTENEKTYEANVLYSNDQADMAVMQVYDEDGTFLATPDYLRFHPTEELELKTKLWNLGFPGGETRRQSRDKNPEIAIQIGNVVDLPRSPSGRVKGILTNVLANQGNSGGPAVDQEGRLVGIVTLAGGGDTSRSAVSILIPADLTREMIRIAFEQRKIPGGIDLFPLFDELMDSGRVYRIPEIKRSADATCVTLDDESVLCGAPTHETITWPTPLGDIAIPSRLFAYFVADRRDNDYGEVLLDGGDRFRILRDRASFAFTPQGGAPMEIELEDVKNIAFRLPTGKPKLPAGDVFVIGGEDFHLSIKSPKGKVAFTTSNGLTIEVPVRDVAGIETGDDGRTKWLETTSGSKLGGRFSDHELTGVLAWSGTPITFSFQDEGLTDARMKVVNYEAAERRGEPPLAESISTSDARFVKIAAGLDAGHAAAQRTALDELLDPTTYKGLSPQKKLEAKRLEGEYLFRTGRYDEAAAVFKKLRNAKLDDVRWHARARLALLERFPGGMFEGSPLTDHKAFERAAELLAGEKTLEAKRTIEALEAMVGLRGSVRGRPPKRSEYLKMVRNAGVAEDSLMIASRLRGGTTEELMVRLWRNLGYLHASEVARLQKERDEFRQDRSRRDSGRRLSTSQQRRLERKEARFDSDIEKATDAFKELQVKIRNAGFIIDDSDRDIADDG